MGRFKKYIILKNDFTNEVKMRLGYPIYHKDLIDKSDIKNGFKCVGGGQWNLKYKKKTITLFGSSSDFGRPRHEDIEKAIKNLNKHDYWQLEMLCERIFDGELEMLYDITEPDFFYLIQYKFIIQDY